jgi:hypothetical protein
LVAKLHLKSIEAGFQDPLSLQDMMSKHSKTPFKRFKRGFCVFKDYQKIQKFPMFLHANRGTPQVSRNDAQKGT